MRNTLLRLSVIVFLVSVNIFVWRADAEEKLLTVAFLDIGQGDAIYIETPSGNQMLIDGGRGKQVLRELGNIMPVADHSIDIVLATHPDADHIGGLPEVFERYDVGMFIEPGVIGDTNVAALLQERVKEEGLTPTLARRGMVIRLDPEVYFLILFPDRDVSHVDSNDGSIVGKLIYGDSSFLLTGDAPKGVELHLVSLDGNNLESDVFKAGHHGSRTSSSATFVEAVSPQYAIISAGKDNQYGHPHKEVIDLFNSLNIEVLATFEEGTIIFHASPHEIVRK